MKTFILHEKKKMTATRAVKQRPHPDPERPPLKTNLLEQHKLTQQTPAPAVYRSGQARTGQDRSGQVRSGNVVSIMREIERDILF